VSVGKIRVCENEILRNVLGPGSGDVTKGTITTWELVTCVFS
jgi:hypothetical protein